ncbi:MAG: hypothetical protein IPO92_01620 [Saprospiraceae bacterium]|nr:hypothetical protein [Saprospiraceae bacterium]
MPQQSWYYKNNSDIAYDLSIYHGDESGHVIIYSNQAIIIIDFGITTDKSYSFYLGEELFELSIKIETSNRSYVLKNMYSGSKISDDSQNKYPTEHVKKALLIVTMSAILGLIAFLLLLN